MAHGEERVIVVCGHLCLDIIPGFPAGAGDQDWFRPGRLSVVDASVVSTGGAVSNVGLSLHRLGVPVKLAARIGRDPLSWLITERISSLSPRLTEGLTAVEGEAASYTVVLSPPGVDRTFLHCPGANDSFTEEDVPDTLLRGAALVHFGYPPLLKQFWSDGGRRLERLFTRARAAGALTSLDMSLPDPASPSGAVDWRAFLSRVLPSVDLFVPSVEELLYMVDRASFSRLSATGAGDAIVHDVRFDELASLSDLALSAGVSAVLIKLGDRGAYLRTAPQGLGVREGWEGRELFSPVFSVPRVAGTTGAGDATIAGFLASVRAGLSAEESLTMAVAVGACCVEAPDATSGVCSWEETRRRVGGGWEKRQPPHVPAGWRTGEAGTWRGPRDRG